MCGWRRKTFFEGKEDFPLTYCRFDVNTLGNVGKLEDLPPLFTFSLVAVCKRQTGNKILEIANAAHVYIQHSGLLEHFFQKNLHQLRRKSKWTSFNKASICLLLLLLSTYMEAMKIVYFKLYNTKIWWKCADLVAEHEKGKRSSKGDVLA